MLRLCFHWALTDTSTEQHRNSYQSRSESACGWNRTRGRSRTVRQGHEAMVLRTKLRARFLRHPRGQEEARRIPKISTRPPHFDHQTTLVLQGFQIIVVIPTTVVALLFVWLDASRSQTSPPRSRVIRTTACARINRETKTRARRESNSQHCHERRGRACLLWPIQPQRGARCPPGAREALEQQEMGRAGAVKQKGLGVSPGQTRLIVWSSARFKLESTFQIRIIREPPAPFFVENGAPHCPTGVGLGGCTSVYGFDHGVDARCP